MEPALCIYLFGDFRITLGDNVYTALDTPRLQILLAYLILHTTEPQSRQKLAFLFWPNSSENQAHTNLRSLLLRLRAVLPKADALLKINRATIQWQPTIPWRVDLAEFDRLVAEMTRTQPHGRDRLEQRRTLEQIIGLYRGELLAGCYEEWILAEREKRSRAFIQTMEQLIALLEEERQYAVAIEYTQRLLHYDPLQEATYRTLMSLLAISGDVAGIVRTYQLCTSILKRDLEVDPSLVTQQLYSQLLHSDLVPAPSTGSTSLSSETNKKLEIPLVGRSQEWSCLQSAWKKAVSGQPYLALIEGEAGIGKTRLAEELLYSLNHQGIMVARTCCYGCETELAYAPLVAWLETERIYSGLKRLETLWLSEVARLIPQLLVEHPKLAVASPISGPCQVEQMYQGWARALLMGENPRLLLIEDLQWANVELITFLHFLLRFATKTKVLVVGTLRREELKENSPLVKMLEHLSQIDALSQLTLLPLTRVETQQLAQLLTQQELTQQEFDQLFKATAGHPLFLIAHLQAAKFHAISEPTLLLATGSTSSGNGLLPGIGGATLKVQTILQRRIAQLSRGARELAELAAAIGCTFTLPSLAAASNLPEAELVKGLDELGKRGIVRTQNLASVASYEFSYYKLQKFIYEGLSQPRRHYLEQRVARAQQGRASNRSLLGVSQAADRAVLVSIATEADKSPDRSHLVRKVP